MNHHRQTFKGRRMRQKRWKLSFQLYGVTFLCILLKLFSDFIETSLNLLNISHHADGVRGSRIPPRSEDTGARSRLDVPSNSGSLFRIVSDSGQRKQPFYKLDDHRFLVLKPGGNGLNNQLQCLNLAANLAIKYNRTLLVGPNAYTGSYHSRDTIRFDELFDVPNAKLSIKIGDPDMLPNPTVRITSFDPEKPFRKELMTDPNPTEPYVVFPCLCGELHHSLPSDSHRDELLLPFHPIYLELAQKVLEEIKTRVHKANSHRNDDFRLLGMHVRRGDLKGYPVFECSDTAFPHLRTFQEGGWWLAACTTTESNDTHEVPGENAVLSWDRVFRELHNCNEGIPLCAKDYDAIFVATNGVDYVRSWGIDDLFVLEDFSFVREAFCETQCHKIKEFVVEEMILAASATFQPSAPSSVTDMILHLRLDMHNSNEQDTSIYQTYDNIALALKTVRKGNIMNWENVAKFARAAK